MSKQGWYVQVANDGGPHHCTTHTAHDALSAVCIAAALTPPDKASFIYRDGVAHGEVTREGQRFVWVLVGDMDLWDAWALLPVDHHVRGESVKPPGGA